jgi:Na+-transporting methylmalonyl-CoA/oxaloacetate decarboxylase gamma subunit
MTSTAYTLMLATTGAASGSPETGRIADGLVLMVVGMFVVFMALVLVGTALVVIRKAAEEKPVKPKATSAPKSTPAPVARTPVETTGEGELDGRMIAILTAAAAAVVGGPVRLRRVQFLKGRTDGSWSAAGRSHIHSSHNFQPRKR